MEFVIDMLSYVKYSCILVVLHRWHMLCLCYRQ